MMHMKRQLFHFVLILQLLPGFCLAQNQMFERITCPVEVNGKNLKFPFAGGLNAPQFTQADLNHDGLQDLVVFERAGNRLTTYLNNGTANEADYTFAPEYACYFPTLVDYVVMRDFDQDGAADIFTSSVAPGTQEIQVYKGYYDGNILKFNPYYFSNPGCTLCDPLYVYYPDEDQPGNWNNLPINRGDIPAFDDINGDGDIDIVTFEAATGGHVWLLENQSVELGLGLGNMRFRRTDDCWGGFYESGLLACINDLSSTPNCCAPCAVGPADNRNHPGSTVTTFDEDGDGDKEVILGDISFSCLNFMRNGGDHNHAWMNSQDTNFPSYDTPADVNVYPASFYLDVNNDGKKDLLVSPNSPTIGEDRKNVWYYQNTASSGHHFELQQRDFFTGDMIDLGTMARPAFADVNGDGLLDLVVGNYGYFTPGVTVNARLFLFLNTGTATQPKFKLEDSDWLGMSEFTPNDYDFAPTFGDLDGDGALDLVVGNNIGGVYVYRNHAGPGQPMNLQRDFDVMWSQMDVVGSVSTPILYDLDQDGLIDIIAGERTGYINFFKNNGTPNAPLFHAVPDIGKIGQIDTRTIYDVAGYSVPAILNTPDGPMLIVGTQAGTMRSYFISQNLQDTFFLSDPMWGGIDVGSRCHPALADIDNDGILEMAVGNYSGGLMLYKTELKDCSVSVKTPASPGNQLKVSPNPTSQWARLEWNGQPNANWTVFNSLGQLISSGSLDQGIAYLDAKNWPSGVYFVEAISGSERGVARLVKR